MHLRAEGDSSAKLELLCPVVNIYANVCSTSGGGEPLFTLKGKYITGVHYMKAMDEGSTSVDIKGAVSRDFLAFFFFMNLSYLVP